MFIPKNNKQKYAAYITAKKNYRKLTKSDEGRLRVSVLILESKGNPPWDSFQDFRTEKADIGLVGDMFADIFLIGSRKPMRFKIENEKVLIRR